MAKINFNVDAYTARLIGRENVSKLEGALIEVVKNTYDADASVCILYYDEKTDTLYLGDNGCGMTKEVLIQHWMTIGRSSKKKTFISNEGRVQTGEKGIGRFALDRIADQCQMITGTKGNKQKLLWTVNWNMFSSGKNITEVEAEVNETDMCFEHIFTNCNNEAVINLVTENWKENGTIFKLTNLRDKWNEDLVKDFRENLSSLIPAELSAEYKIYCFMNTDTIETAEVLNNINAFHYDYKISFSVQNENVDVNLWRAEYDFGEDEDEILKEISLYDEKEYFHEVAIEKKLSFKEILPGVQGNRIGNFGGTLYFSKIKQTKADKARFYQKDITGRADLRDTFGGIKIYRDNFRVRPYGDAKSSFYDWLLLARRKTQSPAGAASNGTWRVSADQMMGAIFISRLNITLPDQSNREGIVETEEFKILRAFIEGIIKLLEEDRQKVYRLLDEYYKKTHSTEGVQEEINRKAAEQERRQQEEDESDSLKKEDNKQSSNEKRASVGVDPIKAKRILDEKDEQIEELENEIKMLRALATTGIVTNTYIHEFKTLSHRLGMKIVMAKEAIDMYHDLEEASDYVNQANDIRKSFNSWFQVTIDAIKKDKRRRKKTNIVGIISPVIQSWNATLKPKKIQIEFIYPKENEIIYKCFPFEIETIINNLVANSVSSFEREKTTKKEIKVAVHENKGNIQLDYWDTGAGLADVYKKNPRKILEPFESDKRDLEGNLIGTGMGLWIVNNTVLDYEGGIDLEKNKECVSGFFITIYLKK